MNQRKNWRLTAYMTAFLLTSPVIPAQAQQGASLDAQVICAKTPRVVDNGVLAWSEDSADAAAGSFSLTCPDRAISSDGQVITVRAATLQDAVALFDESTFFLAYYADFKVRLTPDGTLTADPIRDVPDRMVAEAFRVVITVRPASGTAHILFKDGVTKPYHMPTDQAVTITIESQGTPVPWPKVILDPTTNTIQATIGET